MFFLLKPLMIFWTLPNTLIGTMVGLIGLAFGGKMQFRRGVMEFHSGLVKWLLSRSLLGSSTMAMTLGHSILGQSESDLDLARDHEHIHVKQYEIWGPFFLIAYFGSSLYMYFRGKNPYMDNPFEVEAYSKADLIRQNKQK